MFFLCLLLIIRQISRFTVMWRLQLHILYSNLYFCLATPFTIHLKFNIFHELFYCYLNTLISVYICKKLYSLSWKISLTCTLLMDIVCTVSLYYILYVYIVINLDSWSLGPRCSWRRWDQRRRRRGSRPAGSSWPPPSLYFTLLYFTYFTLHHPLRFIDFWGGGELLCVRVEWLLIGCPF